MKLLSLPIDCLFVLLNTKFTIQRLIPLRALCHHFKSLIESRHCLGRRRSLKIFWDFYSIELFTADLYEFNLDECDQYKLYDVGEDDDLILNSDKFTESTCDFLGRLFPNVRHLTIYFGDILYFTLEHFSFSSAPKLLSTWPLLDGLSIFGNFSRLIHFSENPNTDLIKQIWESIANLRCLKWLDLILTVFIWRPLIERNVGLDFPVELEKILPRLKRLSINDCVNNFPHDVLRHLSSNCKELYLNKIPLPKGESWKSLKSHTIPTNITHLRLTQEFEHISEILNHFSQLKFLDITLVEENFPLKNLLPALNSLQHLTELKLYNFSMMFLINDNFSLYNFPTLSRIIGLTIHTMKNEHVDADIFFRAINHLFPYIEHFTLKSTFIFYDNNGNIFHSSHLDQFLKLKKFVFLVFVKLGEINHYLLSGHLLDRNQKARNKMVQILSQFEEHYSGWKTWSRTTDSQWSISMAHLIKRNE